VSGKLVLVASFPKSGNTWTRIVLERIRSGAGFPINGLDNRFQGMGRRLLFDSIFPVNAADLSSEEIENMLPGMYRQAAEESAQTAFVKVHDMVRRTGAGEWLFPPDCVSAAIYLTRHPFDVGVSNASHYGISVETAVEFLAEDLVPGLSPSLPEWLDQNFGTWSQNVSSWLDRAPYPVAVARYEDLLRDPVPQFLRLAHAAGLAASADTVARAVESSEFARLQRYEADHGFCERPMTSTQFFRSGRMRSWEGVLDEKLRDRLVRDHGAVMRRLGYTADGGAEPWSWEGD
jgi:aryl sulfotransferase